MFITHGDAVGNTLVKKPKPERDTWFLDDKDDFMSGYKSVFPDYQTNVESKLYSMYLRYFSDLVEYFDEIYLEHDIKHRKKNLKALRNDCFEGWLRPSIRKIVKI